ncbi:MAG TPA: aldehyde dehydrogenase family protein [Candidatus Saccharimonadales bacterium]|nr:aldehyde dehydrogenase family protein [Candidatus Saccharimonadales bacterium]
MDAAQISQLVAEVMARLENPEPGAAAVPRGTVRLEGRAAFADVNQAVAAAEQAGPALRALGLLWRRRAIAAMRAAARDGWRMLAEMAVEETGLGRVEDKVTKNSIVTELTPGPEDLEPWVYTGDHGMTLVERAPFGVIGSITPSTNPSETIINNSISMVSGGNTVVFAPHPSAEKVSLKAIEILDRAIVEAGGPPNAVVGLAQGSLQKTEAMMRHPRIPLLVVTGGPGVVKAAMNSGKKAICAGPGNPPVVVDETADLEKAGRDIVAGASIDNNIICTAEKECFVVASVADRLKAEMIRAGAYELQPYLLPKLESLLFAENRGPRKHAVMNRKWVGKDANLILRALGVQPEKEHRLVLAEVPLEHPLVWTEQLLPVFPLVRLPDVDACIRAAVEAEHGFRHTACMHSRNVAKLSEMARAVDCSIFVKNGPNFAGLGFGGEGPTSFTIATPTGEGLTTARTFTRLRRCTLVDYFRIV